MRLFVLIALAVLLSSCSKIRIGYRFADWAIEDSIDDYLDLDAQQSKALDQDIDEYFKWHRTEMVPRYVLHLEKTKASIESNNWQSSHWSSLNQELEKIYYDTASPFKKILSRIFVNMTDEQIEHLEKQIEKENQEKQEEYKRPESERLKERSKKNIKLFKKWMGSVSDEQKLQIEKLTQEIKFPVTSWVEKRQKQQAQLLSMLKTYEKNPAIYEGFLDLYLKQTPTNITKLYYSELDDFRNELRLALVELLKGMSPQQSQHFLKRINRYIRDFKKIAKGRS